MTEWLPNWKRNGLRKSNGQRPSNLDLFCKLDAEVEERERRHDCRVMFWHIDRTHNTVANQSALSWEKHAESLQIHVRRKGNQDTKDRCHQHLGRGQSERKECIYCS
ncbi:hypothetical protein J3R82DRAFT_1559 [Butyriboletus roseoflavus]|nr:hypothetical protein J3R82DRAFT_1559 [Butyriboletus roseoflavus]